MGKFEKGKRAPSAYNPQMPAADRKNLYGQSAAQKAAQKSAPKKSAPKKKKSRLPLVIGILGALCVVAACAIAYLLLRDDEKIVNNVYVAGINLSGKTREEALEALKDVSFDHDMNVRFYTRGDDFPIYTTTYEPGKETAVDVYGKPLENAQVTAAIPKDDTRATDTDAPLDENGEPYLLDKTLRLLPEDVGVKLDVQGAVEEAYRIGRGVGSKNNPERVDVDVSKHLSINETYIRDALERALADTNQEGVENSVKKTTMTVTDKDGNPQEVDALEITVGKLTRKIDIDALFKAVVEAYMSANYELQYVYDETIPAPVDLDKLYRDYHCTEPVNAVIDEDTYEVTEGKPGYGFRMIDAIVAFEGAKAGDTVMLPLVEIEPEITGDNLGGKLFADVLSYYDSPHVYNPTRTHNLELACKAINGTIVKPGETFSFNKVVGERTAEKGYGAAGVYVGGETVQELGGGVCQVASTIFYCTIKADLEVVERAEHQFTPSYIPWGMDATIYWGSLDYKWRNNTPYPIRIDASVSDGYVHIRFVGTDTKDYTVELDYVITDYFSATEKTIDISPDMPNYAKYAYYKEGEVIQTAYDGANVTTYRYKYSKATGELISTEVVCYSKYDKRDRQIAHLVTPTEATEATEVTEPTETDPTETTPTETEPTETTPTETDPTETTPTETDPPEEP
ncbi:MAG: VanW family protein [Oscillospiraceae bacterium]|nr:VanW family protein [Oscillospiraceae bacterium]